MFNTTQLPEDLPKTDRWIDFENAKKDIVNILSEKGLTISQVRYLFTCIMSQFEREMPVTNHKQ